MTTHRLPATNRCPCGVQLDAATNMDRDNNGAPVPGDFTICLECGRLLRFTDELGVRECALPELRELDSTTAYQLLAAQAHIRGARRVT